MRLKMQAKGTRLILGDETATRRKILRAFEGVMFGVGAEEVVLPCVEPLDLYREHRGAEIAGQMYAFDLHGRSLCLRPEGTETVRALAREHFAGHKNVLLWYESRCWRYEQPQRGRYREFTQLGFEWLWPAVPEGAAEACVAVAETVLIRLGFSAYEVNRGVRRGLAYYNADGFEIVAPGLGSQKQIVGGGAYPEGVGFAIGLDRLALAMGSGETG